MYTRKNKLGGNLKFLFDTEIRRLKFKNDIFP